MSFPAVFAADEIEVADLAGIRRWGQSQHEFEIGTMGVQRGNSLHCIRAILAKDRVHDRQ